MANASGLVQLGGPGAEVEVAPLPGADFDVDQYLESERAKDLLRFSTAGSVDDGKSTLIGRLLYDTQSVYEDQVRAIEGKGTTAPGVLDLALLTDGLRAEREQGITIDVAYRYFSTARRKFIIADTPGHEQYTRNMATGASTADVAIVLVDARKGVLVQSRRHAYITALLGVRNIIVAVNKMDLVGYGEDVFRRIERDFRTFFSGLDVPGADKTALHFLPVSALAGDNVVHRSDAMPWYGGPALLELLETLPSAEMLREAPFRMAVQRVVRPNLDFRGFAGQISAGVVRPGDRVEVLPSGRSSRVARIVTYDGDLAEAVAPLSVTLTLEDEVDVSRGDLLAGSDGGARVVTEFAAALVWMDQTPLKLGRRYLLKLGSRTVQAQVRELLGVVDLDANNQGDGANISARTLGMNALGRVRLELMQSVAVDAYTANRKTGSFILIDPQSNATIAAGMVEAMHAGAVPAEVAPVSAAERRARYGHRGAHLNMRGSVEFAHALERALFERGALVLRVEEEQNGALPQALIERDLLVLTFTAAIAPHEGSLELVVEGRSLALDLGNDLHQAVRLALRFLEDNDVLHAGGTA